MDERFLSMRKKMFFVLFAVFCLGLVLIGCGGKDGGYEEPTQKVNEQDLTTQENTIGNPIDDISLKNGFKFNFEFKLVDNSEDLDTIVYFLIDNSNSVLEFCDSKYIENSYYSDIPRIIFDIFQRIGIKNSIDINNFIFKYLVFNVEIEDKKNHMDFILGENLKDNTDNNNWNQDLQDLKIKEIYLESDKQIDYKDLFHYVIEDINSYVTKDAVRKNTKIMIVLLSDGYIYNIDFDDHNNFHSIINELTNLKESYKDIDIYFPICNYETKENNQNQNTDEQVEKINTQKVNYFWNNHFISSSLFHVLNNYEIDDYKAETIKFLLDELINSQNILNISWYSNNEEFPVSIKKAVMFDTNLNCYQLNQDIGDDGYDQECEMITPSEKVSAENNQTNNSQNYLFDYDNYDFLNGYNGVAWSVVEPISIDGELKYSDYENDSPIKFKINKFRVCQSKENCIEYDSNFEFDIYYKIEIYSTDNRGILFRKNIYSTFAEVGETIEVPLPCNLSNNEEIYLDFSLCVDSKCQKISDQIVNKQINAFSYPIFDEKIDAIINKKDVSMNSKYSQDRKEDLLAWHSEFNFSNYNEENNNFYIEVEMPEDRNDELDIPSEGEQNYNCKMDNETKENFFQIEEFNGEEKLQSKDKDYIKYYKEILNGDLKIDIVYLNYLFIEDYSFGCNFSKSIKITFLDDENIVQEYRCSLENGKCE